MTMSPPAGARGRGARRTINYASRAEGLVSRPSATDEARMTEGYGAPHTAVCGPLPPASPSSTAARE